MKALEKFLCLVVPVVIVVGFIFVAGRAEEPRQGVAAPATPGASEIRMYLRVEGIEGECTDDLHKGCMEVMAYNHGGGVWGDPHEIESGTDDNSKAFELTVTRPVGKPTPLLFEYHCRQTPIGTVTLELWREGGPASQKLMVYTGHDCVVAIVRNLKSATADDPPVEEVTFTCAGMEWTYIDYDAYGKPAGETHTQWPGK